MISRSENRLTRNGSTEARSSGPPRLKSRTPVEGVEDVDARDGEAPLVDRGVVGAELLRVLCEGAAQVADGRHADAEHVGGRLRGVPHEVAVESPALGGEGQLVAGQREMVHP